MVFMTLRIFDEEYLSVLAIAMPIRPIRTMDGPFGSSMDHGWSWAAAAAAAAATIGEMYLRENIFEKNGPEKVTLFLWTYMFFKSIRKYDSEKRAVFAVNFHAKMFDFEFSR